MCHLTRAFWIYPLGVNLNEATMMRVMSSCLFVIHELLNLELDPLLLTTSTRAALAVRIPFSEVGIHKLRLDGLVPKFFHKDRVRVQLRIEKLLVP